MPEVLKACIPGCEELEKVSDTEFRATVKTKIGPVSARFKGRVTLTDHRSSDGYKIFGEGEGGVAGFAKGGATVRLADTDGGTALSYNVEAQIGGKLAQLDSDSSTARPKSWPTNFSRISPSCARRVAVTMRLPGPGWSLS